jgi:hypothetical protein
MDKRWKRNTRERREGDKNMKGTWERKKESPVCVNLSRSFICVQHFFSLKTCLPILSCPILASWS